MSRILIVDDEPLVRMSIQMMLSGKGHDVKWAADGKQALAMVTGNKQAFDLIITDILMPEAEGKEFILSLRSEGMNTPVLAISGGDFVSSSIDTITAASDFADGVLCKPFVEGELIPMVNNLLRREQEEINTTIN